MPTYRCQIRSTPGPYAQYEGEVQIAAPSDSDSSDLL